MKIFVKAAAAGISCIMAIGALAGCKKETKNEKIGTVNGVAISDGLFLNNFATEVYNAETSGETDIDFSLTGEDLYNEVKNKQKDGKSYYDTFIDNALDESRRFMIQYDIFSSKSEWPTQSDIDGLKSSAESYMEQMLAYAGASIGASTVQELAQKGYGMTYDNLIDYFTLSSTLEQYKSKLQDKLSPTDEELKAFFEEHEKDYKSVQVRHSLLSTEDMDDDEKAEVYEHAQELVKKYNDGEITFDDIMDETADVDSSGNPNSDGYYTVTSSANLVTAFKEWALSRKEASDEIAIVETEYGYHIMICTKVSGLEDDTVRDSVESAYKTETVNKQADADIEEYLDSDKYKIKDLDRNYIDKIAKRTFTGDFSDVGGSAESATPTPKPEYNDGPADTTEIAKFAGQPVLKVFYVQFFSQAMNEALADFDFSEAGDSEEAFYKLLNETVYTEYKDGKTYIEYAKERGVELLTNFLVAQKMAEAEGKSLSDDEKTNLIDELDMQIDQMLQYYGAAYGVSTRDELMDAMFKVNVNDYKTIYLAQTLVSDYANGVISDMKPEDSAIETYLNEHKDDYRYVTIRRISRSIVDDDGNTLPKTDLTEARALLELLKSKYENGDSAEALAVGYSQSSEATSSAKGLVDLRKASSTAPAEVIDWAFSQTELGAATIIETDSSYELVIIEGFTDNKETKGTVASSTYTTSKSLQTEIENAYKSDVFEETVEKYAKDNSLAVTDIVDSVVENVIKDYLTYESNAVTE